jgi:hypothetical protein
VPPTSSTNGRRPLPPAPTATPAPPPAAPPTDPGWGGTEG